MTLPQYLDPFSADDSLAEDGGGESVGKVAMKLAMKYGRLPYTKLQGQWSRQIPIINLVLW